MAAAYGCGRPRLKELGAPKRPAYSHHNELLMVILESGLLTRPFTLFSSQGLCKTLLYGIRTKKAFTMNGLQDG